MQTIAIISQKGGVGKTTIAIHLATAFVARRENVVLVDLDPQVSAAEWKDVREAQFPAVIAVPSARVRQVMSEAEAIGTDIAILDTAPHSEGTALDAARAANLILIPCQPSIMDLRAMRKTVTMLEAVKKPMFAVLNGVPHHSLAAADEAARTIEANFKLPVAPARLGERIAFNRCLIAGQTAGEIEPESKAAQEIEELAKWVSLQLHKPANKHSDKTTITQDKAA